MRLHSFVQQPVVLLGETGQVNAAAGIDHLNPDQRKLLLDSLPNLTMLRSWTATQPAEGLHASVGTLPLANQAASGVYRYTDPGACLCQ